LHDACAACLKRAAGMGASGAARAAWRLLGAWFGRLPLGAFLFCWTFCLTAYVLRDNGPEVPLQAPALRGDKARAASLDQVESEQPTLTEGPPPATSSTTDDPVAAQAAAEAAAEARTSEIQAALNRNTMTTWLCCDCHRVGTSSPWGSPCGNSGGSRMVAVIMTGLKRRLLLESFIKHVVKRLASLGYKVHVYLSLVEASSYGDFQQGRKSVEVPTAIANLSGRDFQDVVREKITEAGGCVAELSVQGSEVIPFFPDGFKHQMLSEYPPWKGEVGRNVLRTWKSREVLWKAAKCNERSMGEQYAMSMWARPDTFWMGDLVDPTAMMARPNASNALWTKNCHNWGGINDKVALMGRQAADKMFDAYTMWLDARVNIVATNSEGFLSTLAKMNGIQSQLLDHQSELVFGDAVQTKQGPCLIAYYLCTYPVEWLDCRLSRSNVSYGLPLCECLWQDPRSRIPDKGPKI